MILVDLAREAKQRRDSTACQMACLLALHSTRLLGLSQLGTMPWCAHDAGQQRRAYCSATSATAT